MRPKKSSANVRSYDSRSYKSDPCSPRYKKESKKGKSSSLKSKKVLTKTESSK